MSRDLSLEFAVSIPSSNEETSSNTRRVTLTPRSFNPRHSHPQLAFDCANEKASDDDRRSDDDFLFSDASVSSDLSWQSDELDILQQAYNEIQQNSIDGLVATCSDRMDGIYGANNADNGQHIDC
jgi:hypothetical protein